MGEKQYDGVRAASKTTIEIDFYYQGIRCRERIKLKPSPSSLRKASLHRAAVLVAIENGTFDYAYTFPESKLARKFAPSDYTIKSYLVEWLENKKPTLKAGTYKSYYNIINNVIAPKFGLMLLTDLKRADVRKWVAKTGWRNKRISNVLSVFRVALEDAAGDELIDKNPLREWGYKKNDEPEDPQKSIDPFNIDEQKKIITTAIGPDRNQAIVFFWTGMRPSELIALEWPDIDWKRKKLNVIKGLTDEAKYPESPKTDKGRREIDLNEPVLRALKDQRKYSLLKFNNIFFNPATGEPWVGSNPIRKRWARLLRRAKVRYRKPYQTRHTFASMMLSAGEKLQWVSAQMGHANIIITATTYARWLDDDKAQGQKALDAYGQHLVSIEK